MSFSEYVYEFDKNGNPVKEWEYFDGKLNATIKREYDSSGSYTEKKINSRDNVEYFREYYEADAYKDAPVFEGIPDVLESLSKEEISLLVVTSKPKRMAKRVIEHTGLTDYFYEIVGPSDEMTDPSKADLIRTAIEITGADPAEVLMIGDRNYDIEGANDVGVDSAGAIYGYGTRTELELAGATYLVETPMDILKIIQ